MSDSLSNGSLLDRDAPPSSGGTSSGGTSRGGTSRQVDAPAAGVEGPPADGHEARDIEAQELSSEDGYASDGADASGGVDAPVAGVEGPPADEEEERDIEAQELSSVEGDAADAVDASGHINAPAGSVEKSPVDGSDEREVEGLGRSAETAPAVEDALSSGDVEAVASGEVEKQNSGSVDGTPVEEVDLSDKETAPSESGILFKGLFGDVADDSNEYEYVDHPDPDKKCCERDIPKSKFVRTFKFFTRGYAVPWRVMVLVMLHTASIVGITFWTSRYWDKNNSEDCDSLWWCSPLAIDTGTATYVGFALFLLLSFRVNEAYERYTYCIRLWNDEIAGTIHSFCVLCSMAFPRGTFHKNDRKRIFSLAAAYAVTLKRDLRGERDLRELKSMCSPRDLAGIQAAPDMPGHCLYILHAYVMAASRKEELCQSGPFYTMLHGLILKLTSFQGSCMRIKNYKIAYGMLHGPS